MVKQIIGISLAAMLLSLQGHASDSWLCTELIGKKPFSFEYRVEGNVLIHNRGKARSTIIENNSDHIISYMTFLSDVRRYLNNSPPVIISEPFVSYIIIEKASGRMTTLSSVTNTVVANNFGNLPGPTVQTGTCKPN
jgi:hypothetical protein